MAKPTDTRILKDESKKISVTDMHENNPIQKVMDSIKSPDLTVKDNNLDLPIDEGYSTGIDEDLSKLESEIKSDNNGYITKTEIESIIKKFSDDIVVKIKNNKNNLDDIIKMFRTTHFNQNVSDSIYALMKPSEAKIDVNKTISDVYGGKPVYLTFLMNNDDLLIKSVKSYLNINDVTDMSDVIKNNFGPDVLMKGNATVKELCEYINININSKVNQPVYEEVKKYLITENNGFVDSDSIVDGYIISLTS